MKYDKSLVVKKLAKARNVKLVQQIAVMAFSSERYIWKTAIYRVVFQTSSAVQLLVILSNTKVIYDSKWRGWSNVDLSVIHYFLYFF